MYPLVESTHVLFLLLFVGLTVVWDLRLLGIAFTSVPVTEMNDRVLPLVRIGFTVMVITGILLFYGIPVRTYQSVWFRGKVIFLILAMINIWYFHSRVYPKVNDWNTAARLPWIARRVHVAGSLQSRRQLDPSRRPRPEASLQPRGGRRQPRALASS